MAGAGAGAEAGADVYERQLLGVFSQFADAAGALDGAALARLCAALQLEAGAAARLAELAAARPARTLGFAPFRDALLAVLGGGAPPADPSSPSDDSSGRELSPKFVCGSKRYGRRSRPRGAAAGSAAGAACAPGERARRRLDAEPRAHASARDDIPCDLDHARRINRDEAAALCRDLRMDNVHSDVLARVFEEREECEPSETMTVGEFFHRLNRKLIGSITPDRSDLNIRSMSDGFSPKAATNSTVHRDIVVEMWEQAGIDRSRQMLYDLGFLQDRVDISELMVILDEEIKAMLSDLNDSSETDAPSLLLQASLCLHRYELKCIKETMEQVFAENTKIKTDLHESNQRAQILAQEVDENHTKMECSLRKKIKQLETKHADLLKEAAGRWTQEKERSCSEIARLEGRVLALEGEEGKLKIRCSTLEKKNEDLEKQLGTKQEHVHELERVKSQLTKELKNLASEKNNAREPSREQLVEIENLSVLVSGLRMENKSLRDRNDELCAEVDDLQEKLTREKRRLSLTSSKPHCDVDISSEQAVSLLEECELGGDAAWELALEIRGGNAVKRRGDSPSKGQYSLFEDESPRIGKLRRCNRKRDVNEDGQYVKSSTSESGLDCDLDSCSDGGSLGPETGVSGTSQTQKDDKENAATEAISKEQISNIGDTITNIKELFKSVPASSECECCNTVKSILSTISSIEQPSTDKVTETSSMLLGSVASVDRATQIDEQEPTNNSSIEVANLKTELEMERKRHEEEKAKLTNTCRDLEASLEQLKIEYDKCEEYWSNKLDEERESFNEEQKISDEKFTDLLSKISEYEEQFSPRSKNGSGLPTIDEKYSLEIQFTDLEEELQRYKHERDTEIEEKNKEIILLKEQVKHLEQIKINILAEDNAGSLETGSEKLSTSKVNIISNIDKLDSFVPPASSPIEYLWNQSTIQSPVKAENGNRESTRNYQNPAFTRSKSSDQHEIPESNAGSSSDNERELSSINPIKKPALPKRSNSADLLNNHSGCAGSRGYDSWCGNGWAECGGSAAAAGMIQCAELEGQLRRNAQPVQDCSGAWSNESGRRCGAEVTCLMLEQRCRQLQSALRQHQLYLETMQHTAHTENNLLRQQLFNAESAISKLQQRLTSADLLVKELYVENCQLAASKLL